MMRFIQQFYQNCLVKFAPMGGGPPASARFPVPPACSGLLCQEFGKAEPLVYRDEII